MQPYIPLVVFILASCGHVTGSHGNKTQCNHKRLMKCASDIAHLPIPMIESRNALDFKKPRQTVRKFCKQVHPKLNCVYNQLENCVGEMNTHGVEEKAGVLSHVCGEGRKDLISGSFCWLDHNVAHRIRHCREKHTVDDIIARADAGNITDVADTCSTLADYVWSCVGDWIVNRCQYNSAAFLIRVVNPETVMTHIGC